MGSAASDTEMTLFQSHLQRLERNEVQLDSSFETIEEVSLYVLWHEHPTIRIWNVEYFNQSRNLSVQKSITATAN